MILILPITELVGAFTSNPIAAEVICIPLTGCIICTADYATGPDVGTDGPISKTPFGTGVSGATPI